MTATVDTSEPRRVPADEVPRRVLGIVWVAAWIIGILSSPGAVMLLTSLHSEPDAATNPPSFFAPLTLEGTGLLRRAPASPWPP
jgi:sorbitol/mannitol transport system permease protein